MYEFFLGIVILSLLVLFEFIRILLANSHKIMKTGIIPTKSLLKNLSINWSRRMIQQKNRLGVGTTLPFIGLISIILLLIFVSLPLIEVMNWIFIVAIGYPLIMTCISIRYAYK